MFKLPKQKKLIRGIFEHQYKAISYFWTEDSDSLYLQKTDTENFRRTAIGPKQTFLREIFTAGT